MVPFTAVLLAGGFGTRIKDVLPDVPKPMAPLEGKPFLEWVLRYWRGQGVNRFVVSLGHLAPVAQRYLAERPPDGLEIESLVEPAPLGTGGAIRYAAAHAALGDPFLVANADSLAAADCRPAFECAARSEIDAVILGLKVPDASRYGSLDTDPHGNLTGFREKQPGVGLINAGVYILKRRLIDRFPPLTPLSLERDVFPALLASGARIAVVPAEAPFLDIGTRETLALAAAFVRSLAL